MRATQPLPLLALLTATLLAGSSAAAAGPVCTSRWGGGPLRGDTITLVPGASTKAELLEDAIAIWRGCSNYEEDFPAFVVGESGGRVVRVEYVRGSSRAARCGLRVRDVVIVYRSALHDGLPFPCGPPAYNLAHELGHVLGLRDAGREHGCRRHIMASIDSRNLLLRSPQEHECRSVGERWLTLTELESEPAPLPGLATATLSR